ncbi:hypothetical protein [Aquimarina mytili]|uniref:Uncharacterized protein n=1 Tax=Aquimarina mytili TaxID=874423 RepID=A0A937D961_9FLAO|nr:hypothetical protein [Aquimarina mytili]MBL0682183.1 hypothetical protein [Aquimarina mytili]
MIKKFETETEGVLVLVSKKGLQNYYEKNDFDYSYPEGILSLVNTGIVLPITTESTDLINVNIRFEEGGDIDGIQFGQCKLFLEEEDTLQILNHADFTMICDYNKGDIDKYEFYYDQQFVNDLKKGWYLVTLFGKIIEDGDNKQIEIIFDLIWLAEEPFFIQHSDVYVV